MSVMRVIKTLLPIVIGSILSVVATGCGSWMYAPVPHVEGTWTGTIRTVRVIDRHGHTYDAAALEIVSGPSIKEGPIPEAEGAGKLPLLTREKGLYHVIDPATMPLGQLVRVHGTMQLNAAYADPAIAGGDCAVSRQSGQYGEHIIAIAGKPKVLE